MARVASTAGSSTQPLRHDVHRVVSSRFPPVLLFDVAQDAEELELLAALESLTNDRVRDELGQIALVPLGEGVYGPGCTPIMAAFCHPRASRFTDGQVGVYYAALQPQTAILETVFHLERLLRDAHLPPEQLQMRRYQGRVVKPLTRLPTRGRERLLDPDPAHYAAPQAFAAAQRAQGCWGLYYPSVRDTPQGRCVAIFRPRALAPVVQSAHYRYHWNGQRIEHVDEIQSYQVDR